MEVNYIRQMNAVLMMFSDDNRLNPAHVSLYLALFHSWNLNRFRNPVSVSRSEIMQVSRIGSKATYHKCIKELHHWGYLEYVPSHNPYKGSLVYMFIFETSAEQVVNRAGSNPGQALVPSINNKTGKQEKQKQTGKPAGLNEVIRFFKEQEALVSEAEKFFNYYSANGWKVGGRSAMKDWKAAARNWIIKAGEIASGNSKQNNQLVQKQDNLRTTTDKSYDQPL